MWILIILCTRTTIRPYSVPDKIQYTASNRIYFRSVLYDISSCTKWKSPQQNSPGFRTVQLQNIITRIVIIQILTVLSMQNLEFESVMGWLSLIRYPGDQRPRYPATFGRSSGLSHFFASPCKCWCDCSCDYLNTGTCSIDAVSGVFCSVNSDVPISILKFSFSYVESKD
jgi:hypothetical protein